MSKTGKGGRKTRWGRGRSRIRMWSQENSSLASPTVGRGAPLEHNPAGIFPLQAEDPHRVLHPLSCISQELWAAGENEWNSGHP